MASHLEKIKCADCNDWQLAEVTFSGTKQEWRFHICGMCGFVNTKENWQLIDYTKPKNKNGTQQPLHR